MIERKNTNIESHWLLQYFHGCNLSYGVSGFSEKSAGRAALNSGMEVGMGVGRVTESSGSRDLMSCLTQFQESNNLVDLISEKGFHDGRSGKNDGVWLCLHHVELFIHHMTQC